LLNQVFFEYKMSKGVHFQREHGLPLEVDAFFVAAWPERACGLKRIAAERKTGQETRPAAVASNV